MWKRVAFLTATFSACLLGASPVYYPTHAWRESTPEEQGLDSRELAAAVDTVIQKHLNVHSITVIRHGYVVLDAYFYPYRPDAMHDLASVTKSITAAIVGIAVDKGLIKTDRKLLSFFPDEAPANPDQQKQKITVADMLAMRSGLDCGFLPGEQELEQMRHTGEWVKFALGLPMKFAPGEKFGYCSPGYHLLSATLTAATHESLANFGKKNLFEPLGIRDVVWPPDEQGRTHGWGDSHFYPRDFAKFGYLYLHDGQWDGKQIVSADWIRKSTTKQSDPGRANGGGYGYGWWLAKTEGMEEFGGNGRGGQIVAVWPEKDMMLILTGGGYPANEVRQPIAQSIKSDRPLPADPEADEVLRDKVAAAAKAPAPVTPGELPVMAKTISGAIYEFPSNASRIERISLIFNGRNEARLNLRYLGRDLSMPVGLDGLYRPGPYGPLNLLAGATGKWTSDSDFALDLNFISNINRYAATLHFEGTDVQVAIGESSGLIRNGHLTGEKAMNRRILLKAAGVALGDGIFRLSFGQSVKAKRCVALIGDRYHNSDYIRVALARIFEGLDVTVDYTTLYDKLSADLLRGAGLFLCLRDGMIWPGGYLGPDAYTAYAKGLENNSAFPVEKSQFWITDEQATAVRDFVNAGGGFYSLHNNSHVSLTSKIYRDVQGGAYIGHPTLRPFKVRVVNADHPITRGINDFMVNDEQHYVEYDKDPKYKLLEAENVDGLAFEKYGTRSVAGWAYEYGQGRVVFTSPGHTIHALWEPEYVKIERRAIQWLLKEI